MKSAAISDSRIISVAIMALAVPLTGAIFNNSRVGDLPGRISDVSLKD
jgi:hypothetical protein